MRVRARREHWPELEKRGIHVDLVEEHTAKSHAHRVSVRFSTTSWD
jgi:hypothetical protein